LNDALAYMATHGQNGDVFQLNGDTYAYYDIGNNGHVDGTDLLIKIVGVTDTAAITTILNPVS